MEREKSFRGSHLDADEGLHVVGQEGGRRGGAGVRGHTSLFFGEEFVAEGLVPQLIRGVAKDQDVRAALLRHLLPVALGQRGAGAVALGSAEMRVPEDVVGNTRRLHLLRGDRGDRTQAQEGCDSDEPQDGGGLLGARRGGGYFLLREQGRGVGVEIRHGRRAEVPPERLVRD